MPIVSSTYTLDGPVQADGRRYVKESHTDSEGGVHTASYLAEPLADYQAIADLRALQIADALAEAEFEAMIDG